MKQAANAVRGEVVRAAEAGVKAYETARHVGLAANVWPSGNLGGIADAGLFAPTITLLDASPQSVSYSAQNMMTAARQGQQ